MIRQDVKKVKQRHSRINKADINLGVRNCKILLPVILANASIQ
jgi:hypothetical protein